MPLAGKEIKNTLASVNSMSTYCGLNRWVDTYTETNIVCFGLPTDPWWATLGGSCDLGTGGSQPAVGFIGSDFVLLKPDVRSPCTWLHNESQTWDSHSFSSCTACFAQYSSLHNNLGAYFKGGCAPLKSSHSPSVCWDLLVPCLFIQLILWMHVFFS